MKALQFFVIITLVLSALLCETQNTSLKNHILNEVDVLIGSGAQGMVIPVAVVPPWNGSAWV